MNYTGETCEDHICDITSCDNGGTCEVVDGSAYCQCLKGFTGLYCEVDMCKVEKVYIYFQNTIESLVAVFLLSEYSLHICNFFDYIYFLLSTGDLYFIYL